MIGNTFYISSPNFQPSFLSSFLPITNENMSSLALKYKLSISVPDTSHSCLLRKLNPFSHSIGFYPLTFNYIEDFFSLKTKKQTNNNLPLSKVFPATILLSCKWFHTVLIHMLPPLPQLSFPPPDTATFSTVHSKYALTRITTDWFMINFMDISLFSSYFISQHLLISLTSPSLFK